MRIRRREWLEMALGAVPAMGAKKHRALLIDGQNNVIAGHGRLLAARKLGLPDAVRRLPNASFDLGLAHFGLAEALDPSDFRRVLEVNLTGGTLVAIDRDPVGCPGNRAERQIARVVAAAVVVGGDGGQRVDRQRRAGIDDYRGASTHGMRADK